MDFRALNREAIKAGNYTSKGQGDYRKQNVGKEEFRLKQGADTLANLQRAQDYKLTTARAKAEKAALPVPAGDGAMRMDGAAALAPVPAAPPSSTRPSTEPPDVLGDVATGS